MSGTKLQWPPTKYGELCYSILTEAVQGERISQRKAKELLDEWFERAEG